MNLLEIVVLGELFNKLSSKEIGSIVVGDGGITELLKRTYEILKKNSIKTEAQIFIEKHIEDLERAYDGKSIKKNQLTFEERNKLATLLTMIYPMIAIDLMNRIVFSAYTQGDLNIEKLRKGAKKFFSPKIWKNFQDIEKQDLDDCVKCMLTENWTSAGVMAMRAVESAVREYYFKMTKKRKTQWWKILDELKTNPKANQELVEELDYIRKHVRNPLAHPEDRIESHDEAEIVFIHTKKVLKIIYS